MTALWPRHVSVIRLEPIADTLAVVPALRRVLSSVPMTELMRATQGVRPLYTYDSGDPATSRVLFVDVYREVRRLGLRGGWTRYRNGDLVDSGRFSAERA